MWGGWRKKNHKKHMYTEAYVFPYTENTKRKKIEARGEKRGEEKEEGEGGEKEECGNKEGREG